MTTPIESFLGPDRISDVVLQADAAIAQTILKRGPTGVRSGFVDLDAMTGGFHSKDLIVIASGTAVGKTSLALNIAEAAILPKAGNEAVATLIYTLEMSSARLAQRLISSRARVNMRLLRDGLVARDGREITALGQAVEEYKKAPLQIDDSAELTIADIRTRSLEVHERGKLGLIIVDCIQSITGMDPLATRDQQLSEVSRGLKAMAKELDVPVIVLSQLNRSPGRENRIPRIRDIRDSGSIEQDADVVLLLSRPDVDERFQTSANTADLVIGKQRDGPVGELKLTFLPEIARFENFTP